MVIVMELEANETLLVGQWIFHDGRMSADDACARIERLTHGVLDQVAVGNWKILFRDPRDGRFWEKTYPQSELRGGGPPTLTQIPEERARTDYQIG